MKTRLQYLKSAARERHQELTQRIVANDAGSNVRLWAPRQAYTMNHRDIVAPADARTLTSMLKAPWRLESGSIPVNLDQTFG